MASDELEPDKTDRSAAFAEYEREQMLFIARNSTVAQRGQWLEDMLESLRPQAAELAANHDKLDVLERFGVPSPHDFVP